MRLSMRLQAVAELVTPGLAVADVGTDHGFVPVWLVLHGICPRAIALDVKKGPLARARDCVREYGLEDSVETRLSDGLERLLPEEICDEGIQSLIIAGMGGELIVQILDQGWEKAGRVRELILSPHSHPELVRRFLWEHNAEISEEHLVLEEGKYYLILKAQPVGAKCRVEDLQELADDPLLCSYGCLLDPTEDPVTASWLEQREQNLHHVREQLQKTDSAQARLKMESIDQQLQWITKIWERGT